MKKKKSDSGFEPEPNDLPLNHHRFNSNFFTLKLFKSIMQRHYTLSTNKLSFRDIKLTEKSLPYTSIQESKPGPHGQY